MGYLDEIEAKVDKINTCAGLTELQAELNQISNKMLADLNASMASVASITGADPTDLPSVIQAVKDVITIMTSFVTNTLATINAVMTQTQRIITKITDKMSNLGCG